MTSVSLFAIQKIARRKGSSSLLKKYDWPISSQTWSEYGNTYKVQDNIRNKSALENANYYT